MARTCVIYNEQSGAAQRIDRQMRRFEDDASCCFWPIRDSDAGALAARAVEQGFDRLVAAGGDGTVFAVLNGIAPNFGDIEFAVLPLGTGNDLARSLGYTVEDIEPALRQCCSAPSRPMDVVRVDVLDRAPIGKKSKVDETHLTRQTSTFYFANAASGGFGGEVAADIDSRDKRRWGYFAYWMTGIANLADLHEHTVSLKLDDEEVETTAYGIAIANGRYVGGGFCISHSGLLNDGLLNVTVLPVLPAFEMITAGINFTMGHQDAHADISNYAARRIEIRSEPKMAFSIDGEVCGRLDFACEVLPRALRVVATESAPGFMQQGPARRATQGL